VLFTFGGETQRLPFGLVNETKAEQDTDPRKNQKTKAGFGALKPGNR
jgi:hypothetical protein